MLKTPTLLAQKQLFLRMHLPITTHALFDSPQNRVLGLAPKPMISPLMGEWRQLENWGRPLGGANFPGLRRWGKAPISLITHLTLNLFLISRNIYSSSHAHSTTQLTHIVLPISRK